MTLITTHSRHWLVESQGNSYTSESRDHRENTTPPQGLGLKFLYTFEWCTGDLVNVNNEGRRGISAEGYLIDKPPLRPH